MEEILLPPEIYYHISTFINDIDTFYGLLLCSTDSYKGCLKYSKDITKNIKNIEIGVYDAFCSHKPFFYITYENLIKIPEWSPPNNNVIIYHGMQTNYERKRIEVDHYKYLCIPMHTQGIDPSRIKRCSECNKI